jgi:hypothetical protein
MLGFDLGTQDVPIVKAQDFGNQLQALAMGDVNGFGLERFAQRLRHSFGIAKIAHELLCISERHVRCLRC